MDTDPSSLSASPSTGLTLAASLVADIYEAINRSDLSGMIRAGDAEDFPEIKATAARLGKHAVLLERYESALRQYADPGFWDEMTPGGALALHDGGDMARNVLAGRPAFNHRD